MLNSITCSVSGYRGQREGSLENEDKGFIFYRNKNEVDLHPPLLKNYGKNLVENRHQSRDANETNKILIYKNLHLSPEFHDSFFI